MGKVIAAARKAGHDGLHITDYVEDLKDPGTGQRKITVADQWVAFSPEQIKSATGNSGAFNPKDKRITKGFAEILKFDPNQPRDEDGKWTSTGTGTGINSPGFKEWFAQSKIVDENGKPLVVYHGTKKDFDEFTAKYEDGLFFFSIDPKFAAKWPVGTGGKGDLREPPEGTDAEYDRLKQTERELYNQYMKDPDSYDFKTDEGTAAFDADRAALKDAMRRATGFASAIEFEQNAGVRVMPVYLSIQKPFDPRKDFAEIEETLKAMPNGMDKLVEQGYHKSGNWLVYENKTVINKLKELGYDGIWLAENIDGPHETIAAFSPNQIKSATGNSGAFSRTDRRITKGFSELFKYDPNQARDLRGRWTDGSMGGLQMVSPNVLENMGFDDAVRAMGEPRSKEVLQASQEVDGIVGLNIRHFPALGAWSDGAENSLLCRVEPPATYDEIKVSAAMKGMLADQKAVIPFRVEEGGPDSMYSMTVNSSDLKQLNKELVGMGIEYHTLEPTGSSTNVWVFDQGSELRDKIREAAGKYDAQPKVWRGRGEILGSFESRTEGREAYEETIARTLGPDKRGRWEGFYNRWRTTHEVLKTALRGLAHLFKYSPDQPRDQDGQWTKGGADYSNFKTMPSEIEGVPITKKLMSSKRTIARGDILGITLNTSKIARGYWNNLAERQQAHFDSGWFSSPHPNHVIWHELGHVKHHNNGNYSASESYLTNTNGTDAVFARVAKKVSRYAETNAKEFVAEVFAARRAGKIFDADVLRLYKHFGGPE
jgi:ADP-Ribosyltransferase in polyvalent proteins